MRGETTIENNFKHLPAVIQTYLFCFRMNGSMEPRASQSHLPPKQPKNYKLIVDPCLVKGAAKLYRYDGNVPDGPCAPVIPRDPRSHLTRIWTRLEVLDLPVPRFVVQVNLFI